MSTETTNKQSPSSERNSNAPALPKHIREGLYILFDYLWDDELKDFRAAASDNPAGPLPDHIFVHLVSLKAWMEARDLRPDSYMEGRVPELSAHVQWPTCELGTKPPDLPEHIHSNLNALIDYLWHDELTHLRGTIADNCAAGNPYAYVGDHPFVHLVYLKAWMEARNLRPEYYTEDLEPRT